ncbi:cytochrome b5 [Parathielavia appendiculata]|uniref:Cytochrome b5 n=1 Tax=Parathielavia appendiculata TaxID=2587402 RepID=A0AAN6Z199_9PEZI|nr:cytochrome b5 [Parathielavia appendiculata]
MADEPSVRRRKAEPKSNDSPSSEPVESETEVLKEQIPKKPKRKSPQERLDDDAAYSTASLCLDILRVITFIGLAWIGLSYLISNGETYSWGISDPPKYLKPEWWMKQFRGPVYLTPIELSAYDGSDPFKPIYLAINGTIYDVSSNPRTYGPGGSYHYFAGCDAARAYVTGCFAEDRTPDMRGVEDMFLPLDDPAVDKYWSKEELEVLRKNEREEALKKVNDALRHWVEFFRKKPEYEFVGYVKLPEGWPGTEPRRPLCEQAAKGRKKRVVPGHEGR